MLKSLTTRSLGIKILRVKTPRLCQSGDSLEGL